MSERPQEAETRPPRAELAVCVALCLAVGFVFGQTVHYGYVDFDDNDYVYENPHVLRGLTAEGVAWAATAIHSNNWHPLTWLSHMLDCQLYGLRPGRHHLTNVLLHAANAVLLFLVLRRMTGDLWPSAFVAAVFAVHPLRVESVAWVAERKDVLSGLFFMLTLWAYLAYVRRPFSWKRYLTVGLLFAGGVMAKPMVVTTPFVLLLLDYWPLGRIRMARACTHAATEPPRACQHALYMLAAEKIPLLAVAAVSCAATVMAQNKVPLNVVEFSRRASNALVSYVTYIVQLFYPAGLSAFYPYPGALPPWKVWGAILALAAISLTAAVRWRRNPYLLVGWLWYLGMLVPVIGLMQVGRQAMADRYTYLPQIGLCLAIAWGAAEVVRLWPGCRWVYGGVAAAAVVALMVCARQQTAYWRNTETLWTHALDCDPLNYLAHGNLAGALTAQKQFDQAIVEYRIVLKIKPNSPNAHNNLALLLAGQGRLGEAEEHYRQALKIQPKNAATYNNLANLLARQGRLDEAVADYRRALGIRPDFGEVHNNLANRLVQLGRLDEAARHYRQALKILPDCVEAHTGLANALARQGQLDEAVEHYYRALKIRPGYAEARRNLGKVTAQQAGLSETLEQYRKDFENKPNDVATANSLAWLLATCPSASLRNAAEAIEIAGRANRLADGSQPAVLDTLAAAYAQAGRFSEALSTARRALELAVRQNKQNLADDLRARIALYEAGRPFLQIPSLFAVPQP